MTEPADGPVNGPNDVPAARSSSGSHIDLVGLLTGELTPSARRPALTHVRGCAACRDELVVVAAALGELHDAARHAPVDPSEVPPLRLDRSAPASPPDVASAAGAPARRRTTSGARTRVGVAAVAAALLVLAGVGVGLQVAGDDVSGPAPVTAPVALVAPTGGPTGAAGTAAMVGHDDDQTMEIVLVGLRPPQPGTHYTVWLIDTTHRHHARSVGVMPESDEAVMRAEFALPPAEVAGYDAVDVSQESDSFAATAPAHSLLTGSLV